MRLNRRKLITTAGGLVLFAGSQGLLSRFASAQTLPKAYPFTLGIASGDPLPDGFVLWTRLALEPLQFGSGMEMKPALVQWEVAEDERFARIVSQGSAQALPELGHSVHVEVAGLKPARPYWYRFIAGDSVSTVGRVRTAPAAGAKVERLRLGVAGCQHWENGLFTAYRHLSEEPELDAVFHYGDYIYERQAGLYCRNAGKGGPDCVRAHLGEELYSLDDYRRRYAQYKTDPDLQAAHAAAAFIPSYDDHETSNDWAGEWDEKGTAPEIFLLRRFAAFQAWYENMPVRKAQFPSLNGIRSFRRLDYGDLLRIHVLDTRQYRSNQRCSGKDIKNCRPANDAGPESIIGEAQEKWLIDGLSDTQPRWNLLAQQVMMMPLSYPENRAAGRINMDSWSGYPQARQRVIDAIAARKLSNVVVATGDVHKHHAGVVPARAEALDGAAVATEFVVSSIASGGDGADFPKGWDRVPGDNPHCDLFNDRRGYQVFDIGRDLWHSDVRTLDKVTSAGAQLSTPVRYAVDRRKPGLNRT